MKVPLMAMGLSVISGLLAGAMEHFLNLSAGVLVCCFVTPLYLRILGSKT